METAWAVWAGFVDEEGQGTTEYAILVRCSW